MKTILLTGSKGFIGSHASKILTENGYNVIGVDNFHNSMKTKNNNEIFYNVDIRNEIEINDIFEKHKIDLIMHFSGLISVSESVEKPKLYMDVNHNGTKKLISIAKKFNVNKIIFSSTAATYGISKNKIIFEGDLQKPINPYGKSKLLAENEIINSGMKYTIFRYFNVAGSIGSGLGYFPKQKASHLIPSINNVVNEYPNKTFKIFGNDYNTKDGTCVRDYVHVWDLVNAHFLAAKAMFKNKDYESDIFNISSGKGYSVKEVYNSACKVHNLEIPLKFENRRNGDPDYLVASSEKLKNTLNWSEKYTLEDMIKSDYNARFK